MGLGHAGEFVENFLDVGCLLVFVLGGRCFDEKFLNTRTDVEVAEMGSGFSG